MIKKSGCETYSRFRFMHFIDQFKFGNDHNRNADQLRLFYGLNDHLRTGILFCGRDGI